MTKIWSDKAWADYLYWQEQDRKTLRKINSLLRDIERGGGKGTGHAELLKGDFSGFSSVQIDKKNRLVYKLSEQNVLQIVSCKTHYGEK